SPSPLPDEITPLEVVQEFVAAANSGSIGRELADDCVISFFGRHSRGSAVSAGYFRVFISSRYQHEGFEKATFVSPAKVENLKLRFMRSFSWARRRMVEEQKVQKVQQRATSLHLRAESDDEDEQPPPSRCTAELVTPPRPVSQGLDQVKFVAAKGVLKSLSADYSDNDLDFGHTRTIRLTLGYRQVPLAFGQGRHIDICLAVYEKYSSASSSSVAVPRRGSAARCNPPTDDEAEDDSDHRNGARRTLFAEADNEDNAEAEQDEPEPEPRQEEEEPSLEHTPARVEVNTQEESALEETPPPSIRSCTPRKRHIASSGGEVKPKRTPRLNRLRF
ncbi:hypothetical protein KR059_004808, partial [Drosophila kikkawai]